MNNGINIYEPAHHLGYPPLWALWCSVAHNFYLLLGSNLELWRFIIKLPLILAHLGLAQIVGMFVSSRFDKNTGLKMVAVILGWPFFIYIGAMWGQINLLSAFLTFSAFYAILKQKLSTSALLLGTAITSKSIP